MKLVIDTTKREKIIIGLSKGDKTECFDIDTENQSSDLLPAIENILKKNKLSLQNIESILVNQGPGSFTGTRVGIAVANSLSWSLNIPVFGFTDGKLADRLKEIKNSSQKDFKNIVLPYYEQK